MTMTVRATYENGVLKPAKPLPLQEREEVHVTIARSTTAADRSYGMIGWRGDPVAFESLLEESEAARREPT